MSNPYTLEPSHRSPGSKATILQGRMPIATVFRDGTGPADARVDLMLTAKELRHVADLMDEWAP